MNDFYDDNWYDARWQAMPPMMRKIAANTIQKVLSEEDQELIRRKHAEHGHDWIHHLIDVSEEERAKMDALLPESQTEEYSWPATMSAHHGFGTSIRNLLRDEELGAGIKDDDLPKAPYENGESYQNWDDVYVQAIEAAVGLREI